MAAIRSLLNPLQDEHNYDSIKDDASTHDSQASAVSDVGENAVDRRTRKKQKICKDAAVFKPGATRGECRYPPYDDQDDLFAAKHQMYEVYPPVGEIAAYPRHIPYNSEKKLFLEKTGRESFEGIASKALLTCGRTDFEQCFNISSRSRETQLHTPCYGTTTLAWSVQHHCSSVATTPRYGHEKTDCTSRHPLTRRIPDNPGENVGSKCRIERTMSQHHGRSSGCTRYTR